MPTCTTFLKDPLALGTIHIMKYSIQNMFKKIIARRMLLYFTNFVIISPFESINDYILLMLCICKSIMLHVHTLDDFHKTRSGIAMQDEIDNDIVC